MPSSTGKKMKRGVSGVMWERNSLKAKRRDREEACESFVAA